MSCSETSTNSFCFPFRKIDSMYRKQSSTIIKFFKKYFTTTEKFLFQESKGKLLLNNYNRNSWGQPSGWIGWLLISYRVCTYRDHGFGQPDKKRSSWIIILLYFSLYCYCGLKVRSHFWRLFFGYDDGTVRHRLNIIVVLAR